MLTDLSSVEFPPVGTSFQVLINHESEGILMACPVMDDSMATKYQDLAGELDAYVSSVQPYKPSEFELCVAKWIGK